MDYHVITVQWRSLCVQKVRGGEGVGRSTNRLAFVSAFSSVPSTFSERSGEWSSTLSYFMYT